MNPMKQLEACGQSAWLDYLKRSLVKGGELQRLIDEDGLKGVTSNPSIFEKAIAETDEYADDLMAFAASGDRSPSEIYEQLAIADIRAAADVLRPVFDAAGGADGFVSLECSPYLADDTEATVREGLHLWAAVDRPNLMVKVPGTAAGMPAVRRLTAQGVKVNITLLFGLSAYEQVVEAFLSGLEDLQKAGGDLSRAASVASFFVSRIDTAVDKRLDALGDRGGAAALKGKVAIANAKLAYARYKVLFAGPRWDALARAGARPQRLLWASTSTKTKALKDTAYVESLIGPQTVNTLPPATIEAFRDHGVVRADALESGLDEARATLAALAKTGVSLDQVTAELVVDGVRQFAEAFDKLFASLAERRPR